MSIGQVWTQASITATVSAGTGINTVEAWNNISGSIRALAGPIRLVSAGTKDSYGHVATGGSISSSVIYAGKSIGSVIARKVISTQGVAPGGNIQVAGGITAGGGYVGQVSAGDSVAATVTAVDDIGSVVAGNSISGTVESQHGAVLIVTATTGAISGQVKAKLNVGDVTAGTDRIGETKAETGSIGNIKATSGKIDGEINGLKGIGNITAGTSILKSITTAGAGASIGHIRAGAATAGNILGAIAANGNILSIKATAVNDEDLPSGSTAVPIVVAPLNGGKPVRQTVTWPKVYAGGDIAATIYAGGGIFDVIAHGRIAKSIHAGAELPSVLGYKRISADITAGKGGVAVTTYGELRGDISAPGSSQVWAYDDISGGIEIADGGLSVVTWGSFLSSSEAVSKLDAKVWAYCEIVGDRIESTHGTASATGLDSIDTKIRGMMSAIATTGGGLAGSLDAQTLNGYLAAAQNSSMSMSTGRSATLRIDGELAAEIKAGGATKAIVGSITGSTKVRAAENYAASAYINVLRDVDHADIYSRRGSIYLEARNVLHTTVTTSPKEWPIWDGGGIAIHADGNISQTVVESNKLAAIYATGIIDQTKVTATHDSVSVAGVRGVQGEFQALDEVAGAGNVSVTSWAQITGLVNSKTGGVKTQAYGGQNTTIYAGLLANVTVWGSLDGQMNVGSARILARNDVNSTITATGEFDGFVEVIAGGNITGAVTTNLTINPGFNRNRYVTLRALGHVTGGAKATEQVAVFANNVSGEYKSLAKGVLINAFGSMTGQARGLQDVIVFAGQNISGGGSVAAATTPPAPDENSAFASFNGSVYLGAAGELSGIAAYAGVSFSGVAAGNVSSTNVTAHGSSSLTSFGGIAASSITTTTGDVTAFAGESAALTLTTHNGNISVVAIGDLAGTFAGSGEVSLVSFGSASGITASGDGVHLFGHHHADGSLTGESAASMESAYAVSGMLDADVAVVLAGHESTANVESRRVSTVVAGHHVSGIVKSTGVSTVVSAARGSVPGGVSATVEGRKEASVIALGGSVTGNVKSIGGSAFAFAGMDVTSTIDGKTSATAVAIQNVSGGVIKSAGPAKAVAFNNVSSRVESTGSYAFVVAGDNVSGNVKASGNAIVAAVSGAVSGEIESTGASTIAIGMDGISGAIKAHRHSVALSFGTIGGDVTASNGCAVVVSVAGGVSGAVDAAECVLVVSFDGVSGKITADQSILVASLAEVTGEIEAEEYAIVIAAGNIGGSSVTAGKSALVASLGNVTSTVTAEDGSALIIALGNVTTTASATEIVAVIALGDVTIHVPQSQDLIVISGGKTDYKYQPPAGTSAAASLAATSQPGASATRDMVLVGTGNVSGSINSGRDAILVSFGTSSAKVTAARDAVLFALNGIGSLLPNSDANVDAGGDAIVISGATARSNVVGGKNAILVSLESASGSTVTAGDFGAVMTLGSGNNLNVTGDDGAFAWTYGGFTGNVTSSAGSAVLVTVGTATQAIVHGKDNALAVTVGSFDGTVTADDEYAGIISLLNALGTVSAGKGAMVVADGSVNVEATADEDLLVWARGNVNGTFNAGRDAAVVSHGTYDAALSADRDIVFAYAGTSLKGSLTAGRWIGDGSTSPPGDPTEIDDVFSHGDILAQILAGTSASSDPYKGRIGTIASIGNAGGVYTAQHINRIRTAGIVTASMQTSSASFAGTSDGSGPSGGSGTTIILQNQSTLATDVPKPVLDPSERDEVLADAGADKADANADRQEVIVALDLNRVIIAALRQAILDEVAALRAEIREQADELHTAVDTAVDSAQWWTQVGIRAARVLIEGVYQRREAGYLNEQRRWEEFRETAKDILNQGVQNWASLRAAAQTAFEKGDTEMEQQRNRLFASEAGHLQWHENRWLEDKAAVDREIAGSVEANAAATQKMLEGVKLALDVGGLVPGVGIVPDVISAMISAGQGNYGEALFSLACAVPFWGDGARAGKMMAKGATEGVQHLDEAAEIASSAARRADGAADEIVEAGDEATDGVDSLLHSLYDDYWQFGRAISADEASALAKAEGFGFEIGRNSRFENARNAVVIGKDKLKDGMVNTVELAEEIQHGLDRVTSQASAFMRRYAKSGLSPNKLNDLFHAEHFERIIRNWELGKFQFLSADDINNLRKIIEALRR